MNTHPSTCICMYTLYMARYTVCIVYRAYMYVHVHTGTYILYGAYVTQEMLVVAYMHVPSYIVYIWPNTVCIVYKAYVHVHVC